MESKFKIGDEVVCVDREEDCWYDVGDHLIISSEGFIVIEPYGSCTVYNIEGKAKHTWIDEAHFKLAEDLWESRKLGCDEKYVEVAEGSKEAVDEALGIKKHNHYFKDCPYDKVDVYRILDIFDVTDPCLQHLVKKGLCAGKRGHKDFRKDLQDIIDTAQRRIDMLDEDKFFNE